jgi:hypothetical protein
MSPEAWQKQAIEFLLGDGLNHPARSALFRSRGRLRDRAANAVSGRPGCSARSAYFFALLACRFSFSVFCAGFFSMLFFVFLSLVAMF